MLAVMLPEETDEVEPGLLGLEPVRLVLELELHTARRLGIVLQELVVEGDPDESLDGKRAEL